MNRQQGDRLIEIIKADANTRHAYFTDVPGEACVIGGIASEFGLDRDEWIEAVKEELGGHALHYEKSRMGDYFFANGTNNKKITEMVMDDGAPRSERLMMEAIGRAQEELGISDALLGELQATNDRNTDIETRRQVLINLVNHNVVE